MVQGMGIPPSQLQRELADEEQHERERAVAGGRSGGERGSTIARPGPRAAIRLVLLLAALIALRFGVAWMQDWDLRSRAYFLHTWQGWVGWLSIVVLSGFLFGLAARLPRRLRYRPWTPLAIGLVPLLMLAHFVAVFGSDLAGQDLPLILTNTYFYMTFEAQFALAIMLGVALAMGFESTER